ncbi:MAG: LPS export ABC transporter periplasmic protein LptC [Limnobacter sp.]|nr:LPS export ABC transporter periplasmic protein LptC [Limnobacter sp.]
MLRNLASFVSQFAPLLITFLLAASSYWVALQSERGFFGDQGSIDPKKVDYFMEDFRSEEHQVARGYYSLLTGVRAEHIPENDVLFITNPVAQRYQESEVQLHMRSGKAEYEVSNDILHMEKDAHLDRLKQGAKTTLNSDKVTAEFEKNKVYSNLDTTVITPGRAAKMKGFELDTVSGDLQSKGHTSIRIEAK